MDIFFSVGDEQVVCSFIDEINTCITRLALPSGKVTRTDHDAEFLGAARRHHPDIKSAKLVVSTDDWIKEDGRLVTNQAIALIVEGLKSGAVPVGMETSIEAHRAAVAVFTALAQLRPGDKAAGDVWKMITAARRVVRQRELDAAAASATPFWKPGSSYDARAAWSF
ncbi:MAG: hypothetical protein PHZ23_15450 [Acidiphilium sp.]|nr:hypothetical protein [Acidiphilium sp.]